MPRLLFEKVGSAVFISHLDLMRVFQRAFRRGGILIRHSQGFSPRAHVSIALPLSVGAESICELLDFDLAEGITVPLEEIPQRLNRTMPDGIRVLGIWDSGRKLRELTHLDAELTLEYDNGVPADCTERIESLFQQPSILVEKHTKNGTALVDIRPMLIDLQVAQPNDNSLRLRCRVCAQNPSLNPALLATAIVRYLPQDQPDAAWVRRIEILDWDGNPFR